jgi:N-hydroxyarylamine O-acetyltransferase
VLRGEFGLNISDPQIDECVAIMKAKATGDAPHPFFA